MIVLDGRNARLGGGRTVLSELREPLRMELARQAHDLLVLDGPPADLAARWRYRNALLRASATLHTGNRATVGARSRRVVCVQDRLLVEPPTDARVLARQTLLLSAIAIADALVVPSASMVEPTRSVARLIRRDLPVRVIRHGRPSWASPADRAFGEPLKLLYPSHVYRHKNFLLLARLMKRLSIPATLTLTAQASDLVAPATTVGELFGNARDRVRFIGDIDSRRMAAVYEAHDILIFPSLCEAFGLPLVEAMTMNMPIVASRLDWSIEICSEHAMYADPHDESDWAEKIAEVFRRGRRTNPGGVVRSQDFDWAQAASQYARLLLDR